MDKKGGNTLAPRRQNNRKKGKATEEVATVSIEPWPREENQWFEDCSVLTPEAMREEMKHKPRKTERQQWDDYDSMYYNGLLKINMECTRFICETTLDKMGILEDVKTMLDTIGLGHIAHTSYKLYPDLVRQFLASVSLNYKDRTKRVASEATLSFFSGGRLYTMSITELCGLYGFKTQAEDVQFPEFPFATKFWNIIGSGIYLSREAKQAMIRNPAIRVVAKVLSNTLFSKSESGSVTKNELLLLYLAVGHMLQADDEIQYPFHHTTNFGIIFAEVLVGKKNRGLARGLGSSFDKDTLVPKKTESVGSLLTPIFQFHGIDLDTPTCEKTTSFLDAKYFENCGILKKDWVYKYLNREGESCKCKLPQKDITSISSRANIDFSPAPAVLTTNPTQLLCPCRGRSFPRDNLVPDFAGQHTAAHGSTEPLLPPYSGEYDLRHYSPEADEDKYKDWIVDSQQKNNDMLKKIWGALSRIRVPRPSSCYLEPATDMDETDVAGSSGAAEVDMRLERSRKVPDRSRSVSPSNHPRKQ